MVACILAVFAAGCLIITMVIPAGSNRWDIITIRGLGFKNPAVFFYNSESPAEIESLEPTKIVVRVPYDASTGPIDIYDSGEWARYETFYVCGPQPPVAPVPCYFSQADEHDWGKYVSMAQNGLGNVYVSFYDAALGQLVFAHYNTFPCDPSGPYCKRDWIYTHFDIDTDFGKFSSIAVHDETGSIAISAVDGSGNLHVVRFVRTVSIPPSWTWLTETVDGSGEAGGMTGIAMNPSTGCPMVTYYNAQEKSLMFASSELSSGPSQYEPACEWKAPEVVDGGDRDVGLYNSLAASWNGEPVVCYYDKTRGNLMYATKSGGSWILAAVDTTGDVGRHCDIAVGSDGRPMLSYSDTSNGALKYADFDPAIGSWRNVTIVAYGSQYEVTNTHITVGENGMPYISFARRAKDGSSSLVGYTKIEIEEGKAPEDNDFTDPKSWAPVKWIGSGSHNDIVYYNHSPRIVYYNGSAPKGSKNLHYWYDQNFEMGIIIPRPCPPNPETVEVEVDNNLLEDISSFVEALLSSVVKIEIDDVPIDKRGDKCPWPSDKYWWAVIGRIEFEPVEVKGFSLFWGKQKDIYGLHAKFTFKNIEAKGYADVQAGCVEWGQVDFSGKVKDMKLEFEFLPVVECSSMRLESGKVFFHKLTKHNVDIDIPYIGSDIESEIIDPYVAEMINDQLEEEASDIEEKLEAISLDPLFLEILKSADRSGFLASSGVDKLSEIAFVSAEYTGNKATFVIDKNKTLENIR